MKDSTEDPEFSPLARTLVFQESILLPGLLRFTRDELVWECMQIFRCECGKYRHAYDLHKRDMSDALIASDQPAHEINLAWHDVVAGYTCKNLTYDQDRLPSRSGLAKRFGQMKPGVEHLVGLWGMI